jgi:uncharacterized surface protein with fasciclin (FAS1) repeats
MLKKLVPLFILVAVASNSVLALANDNWSSTTSSSKSSMSTTKCGMSMNQTVSAKMDIVGTAVNNSNFSTLVAALKAAGLVDALKGNGPFTVFAPTNAAFAKLPAGTVENLLKPENKAQLQEVLKYHVLQGNVPSKDIQRGKTQVNTLQGEAVEVERNVLGNITVEGAKVVIPDVATTNGTIHAIDTVLIPE